MPESGSVAAGELFDFSDDSANGVGDDLDSERRRRKSRLKQNSHSALLASFFVFLVLACAASIIAMILQQQEKPDAVAQSTGRSQLSPEPSDKHHKLQLLDEKKSKLQRRDEELSERIVYFSERFFAKRNNAPLSEIEECVVEFRAAASQLRSVLVQMKENFKSRTVLTGDKSSYDDLVRGVEKRLDALAQLGQSLNQYWHETKESRRR